MKILIADDSDIVRKRLVDIFRMPGVAYSVLEARSAEEAIKHLEREDPDIAILDIQMPGGSGIDVLRHIRVTTTGAVVIMYTSYPYPQYRERCMAEGADYFFDKTTESRELIETIQKIINSKTKD